MSSGVEFEEDQMYRARPAPTTNRTSPVQSAGGFNTGFQAQSDAKGMAGWLVRNGWAKTDKGAQGVMLGLVVINIIITLVVINFFI